MNVKELKKLTVKELKKLMLDLLKERFNLQMQKGVNDVAKPHLYKKVRRNIARIKTVLNQNEEQKA